MHKKATEKQQAVGAVFIAVVEILIVLSSYFQVICLTCENREERISLDSLNDAIIMWVCILCKYKSIF